MTSPQPQLRGHGSEPHCDPEHGCITCGDVAVAMRVLRIDHERELALGADESGERHTIEVALVQPVEPGDELLVHAGTAIARLESERPAGDPAGADAEAQAKGPSRRRGQGMFAGAEQPAGVAP